MTLRRAALIAGLGILVFVPPVLLLLGIDPPSGSGGQTVSGFAAKGLASTPGGRLMLAAWWLFLFGLIALVILKFWTKRSNNTPHTDARSSARFDQRPSARAGGRGR
jgi:hypothetical protein